MPTVFIVSKSSHDFSSAKQFGEFEFLSDEPMNKFDANNMARMFGQKLESSSSEDFILPCGLSVMNMVACAIFAAKHKRLNLLLYLSREKRYKEVNLVFNT